MAKIVETAIENAGYDKLSAGDADAWAVLENDGIKKLKDYDVDGLHGPVTYSEGDNRLAKSVRVFQVQGGNIEPLTDWIDAPVVEYEKFDWFGQ
jgi:branched-chain amino acid transport system substrate-binding protein